MAVRIRKSGEILCAATHPRLPGDTYIDDGLHYTLSAEKKLLVTEPMELPEGMGQGGHAKHGRWWWRGQIPADVVIDPFYTVSRSSR